MRLSVVLVQTSPAAGVALSESLVGNLIGRPGLDLILVDRLDRIAEDSTDRLTLDSISGDFALLDWRSPGDQLQSLQELGIQATRWPHQSDLHAEAISQPSRQKAFLFDLNQFATADQIIRKLNQLRESLAVKTINLGGLSSGVRTVPTKMSTQSTETVGENDDIVPRRTHIDDEGLDALINQLDDLDV